MAELHSQYLRYIEIFKDIYLAPASYAQHTLPHLTLQDEYYGQGHIAPF